MGSNVLKDKDGRVLDATDIVAYYLHTLPDHTVNPEPNRVRLLSPLPTPISVNREIQSWRGVAQPSY